MFNIFVERITISYWFVPTITFLGFTIRCIIKPKQIKVLQIYARNIDAKYFYNNKFLKKSTQSYT